MLEVVIYNIPQSQLVLPGINDDHESSLMGYDNNQPTSGGEEIKPCWEVLECACETTGSSGSTLPERCKEDDIKNYFIEITIFEEMNSQVEEGMNIRLSLDHPHVIKTYSCTVINTPNEYGFKEVQHKEEQTDCVLGRYLVSNEGLTYNERKELILKITEGLNYLQEQNVFIHVMKVSFNSQ